MIRNIIKLNDDQKKKVEELVNNSLKVKSDPQIFFARLTEIVGLKRLFVQGQQRVWNQGLCLVDEESPLRGLQQRRSQSGNHQKADGSQKGRHVTKRICDNKQGGTYQHGYESEIQEITIPRIFPRI